MGWVANLANGATVVEGKPEPGQLTPWQNLLKYCRDNDTKITGLRLTVGNVTVEAMPSKMCDGYFQAYEAFKAFWGGTDKLKQGIGSVVGDKVYIIWIDISEPRNYMNYVHQEIRLLSELKIHTTMN